MLLDFNYNIIFTTIHNIHATSSPQTYGLPCNIRYSYVDFISISSCGTKSVCFWFQTLCSFWCVKFENQTLNCPKFMCCILFQIASKASFFLWKTWGLNWRRRMNRLPIPTCARFFKETMIGIAIVVFLTSIAIHLWIRPPSMVTNTLEGVHVNWIRLIVVSVIIAASIFIYPLFVQTTGEG